MGDQFCWKNGLESPQFWCESIIVSLVSSCLFKYPWARVLCYKGGLGKSGKQQLQEVARYPSEITNHYSGPTYPSLVLPFNRIHLKIGGCSVRPSKKLHVLSLPTEFPLSLAFTHALCTHCVALFQEDADSETTLRCIRALSISLDSLSKLITRLEMPQLLKECTLHLMSEVILSLCSVAPSSHSPPSLSPDLPPGLRKEVLQLYELEVGRFSKSKQKTKYPPPGSIMDGGQGKFSTYFQALLECFLATNAYRHKLQGVESDTALSPSSSSSSSGSSTFSPPQEPPVKKTSTRRFRARHRGLRREASETDPRRKEEWLGVVGNASQLLTSLTALTARGSSSSFPLNVVLPQSHSETSLTGSLPVHPNSRLIVVTGIRPDLPIAEARAILCRTCQSFGGLFEDHLYLPVQDDLPGDMREKMTSESGVKRESEGVRGEERDQVSQSTSIVVAEEPSSPPDPSTDQQLHQQESLSDEAPTTHQLLGHAVLELCCSSNVSAVCDALLKAPSLQPAGEKTLSATAVSDALVCGEANRVLGEYLQHMLVEDGVLRAPVEEVLRRLFESGRKKRTETAELTDVFDGDLLLFFGGFGGGKGPGKETADAVWKEILGKRQGGGGGGRGGRDGGGGGGGGGRDGGEGGGGGGGGRERGEGGGGGGEGMLHVIVEDFLEWCKQQAISNALHVWLGLFSCGYDFHLTRYYYMFAHIPRIPCSLSHCVYPSS